MPHELMMSPAQPIAAAAPSDSNGILPHGGPVMTGGVNVYYIWYGNWSDNTATTIPPDLGKQARCKNSLMVSC